MDEVVLEYRRVMCDLMWRSLKEKQPDMFNFIAWEEIDDTRDITVPEVGKARTDMEDYVVFSGKFPSIYSRVLIDDFNAEYPCRG